MKFILSRELGRLTKWLRILGYDSKFFREENLSTLIITALREERIILTRNSRISRFPGPRMILIDSDFVDQQIKQVLKELKLKPRPKDMFTRCTVCNTGLEKVARAGIKEKVPEYVYKTQESFRRCPQCQRIYWPGTHWGNVRRYLKKIRNSA